jgi:ribulose-5-phosphate 4-epimerase/fuculose-1-phosphate aldolase
MHVVSTQPCDQLLQTKVSLAAAYRIIAHLGLDDWTYTHLSARPQGADFYYIFPFGMTFAEVTASALLKVDFDGNVLEGPADSYNPTGYVIHGSIYKQRPDLGSIFHLHTHASIAVSAMPEGLLPISQWALHFYEAVAYYDYDSLTLDQAEQGGDLVDALGDKKVMLMRNHGMLTAGETVHEAMFYTHHLEQACRVQAMSSRPPEDWIMPSSETCRRTHQDLMGFESDLGRRDWDAYLRLLARVAPDYAL